MVDDVLFSHVEIVNPRVTSRFFLVQILREFYVPFCENLSWSLFTMTTTTGIPNALGPKKSPTNLPSTPKNGLKRFSRSNLETWGFFSLKQMGWRGWPNDNIQNPQQTMIIQPSQQVQPLLNQYAQMIRDSMTQFDVTTEGPQPTLTFSVQSGQSNAVGQMA
jgi:hypothetical protein